MSSAPQHAPSPGGGAAQGAGNVKAVRAQLELMEQDCARVSAPDYTTPFKDIEDAVDRLLPFHMFGAEDPQQTDAREAEGAAAPARLATTRHEAWQDLVMHKVNEYCAGLVLLEKKVRRAEDEALARSQLPLLMLQSYATAESQAAAVAERNRPADEERRKREKVEAEQRAIAEVQRQQQLHAEAQALAQQQQAAAMAAQRQQLLLMQQQQAAAARQAAAAQQAAATQQQQQQQRQPVQQPGAQQQLGQPPGSLYAQPGVTPAQPGMAARPSGQPQMPQPAAPRPAAPQLTAAQQKAAQLAALKARISQRK